MGALLGDAFIHLIPQAFERDAVTLRPSLLILGGMLLFFVVEKLLRHEHGLLHKHHHPGGERASGAGRDQRVWRRDSQLHRRRPDRRELPRQPGSGRGHDRRRALPRDPAGARGLRHPDSQRTQGASGRAPQPRSASAAILGAITALLLGAVSGAAVTMVLIPVTAGGFVYIAAADLIPELQHDRTGRGLLLQVSLIALGMGVMGLLAILE